MTKDIEIIETEELKPARYAVIDAEIPERLTKRFYLCRAGWLRKENAGQLVKGSCAVYMCDTIEEFADGALGHLNDNQALTYGTPRKMDVEIVTKSMWETLGKSENAIPRTKEHFTFRVGEPAIMMIDYDPQDGTVPMDADSLVETIREAAPGLADVTMVSYPSASSNIYNSETGEEVKGAGGLRVYLMVEDGFDIPRAGKALFDRLWLDGHGYIAVSKSAQRNERTIIDGAVFQGERLDFAAGASCEPPLEQRRGEPVVHAGERGRANTEEDIPDLTDKEHAKVVKVKVDAKAAVRDLIKERGLTFDKAHACRSLGVKSEEDADKAAFKRAMQAARAARGGGDLHIPGRLWRDWPIYVQAEEGAFEEVTVGDILGDPDKYDGALTLDPLEPDYDGGRVVGQLRPHNRRLHSFARGSKNYELVGQAKEVLHVKGHLDEVIDESLDVMRGDDRFYDYGGVLAKVSTAGKMASITDAPRLQYELGKLVRYRRQTKDGNMPVDPWKDLAVQMLAVGEERGLKPLKAVVAAPTMRLDGTIIDEPGYDAETQLYVALQEGVELSPVPEKPTLEEAKAALETLMFPVKDFPMKTPHDRGGVLAMMLTAVVRQVLPVAPFFALDAPNQGTGKTLLAMTAAAMADTGKPRVQAHIQKNEEEIAKSITSYLLEGTRVLVWDNVLGSFDSHNLAKLATDEMWSARILGGNKTARVANSMTFIATGNNFDVRGDMARRMMVVRLDAEGEVMGRKFDIDPVDYVREHRLEMVAAALTLMRAAQIAEAPDVAPLASFEKWDSLVRRAVIWVIENIDGERFADPVEKVLENVEYNPGRVADAAILEALHGVFGEAPFRAKDVEEKLPGSVYAVVGEDRQALAEAFEMLDGGEKPWKAGRIGRALANRKDRVCGDLKLVPIGNDARRQKWAVRKLGGAEDGGSVVELNAPREGGRRRRVKAEMGA